MSILVHTGDEILSARYVRILRGVDRCVAEVDYPADGGAVRLHYAIDPAAWDAYLRSGGSGMLHVGVDLGSLEMVQAYLRGRDV